MQKKRTSLSSTEEHPQILFLKEDLRKTEIQIQVFWSFLFLL